MRHLVADISCLDKDLDLRLMLTTKRILTGLTVSFDLSHMEMNHPSLDFNLIDNSVNKLYVLFPG